MNFSELIVLLPCHSLEDFPTYHEGDDADGLLAAWSAIWHPALLANAGRVPEWYRVDSPPAELTSRLIVVPSVAYDRLPAGFAARAQAEGATLVARAKSREEILDQALAAIAPVPNVDADLVADFLALSFCRLQVELLTRQMRYSSNLDEMAFNRFALAAAQAAVAGNLEDARRELAAAFHLLGEARKYFYPVDSYLIDLTLVAPTTLGSSLENELGQKGPVNLLLPAELVERIARDRPDVLAVLKLGIERGSVSIASGDYGEKPLPLLPLEIVLAELTAGIAQCEQVLACRPHVFGRRRYGLDPSLPQVLAKLGIPGALHFTLDDGHFPLGGQSKVRWQGDDRSGIDALARLPRDAGKAATFLDFARRLGESMDSDHVATLVMAHWPGMASPWYADLRRVERHTSALGKFITLADYFTQTYEPTQTVRFLADEYRAPYLGQAIIGRQADAISSIAGAHAAEAARGARSALETLAALLSGKMPTAGPEHTAECEAGPSQHQARCRSALDTIAAALTDVPAAPARWSLVVNPLSFTRHVLVESANGDQAGTNAPSSSPPAASGGMSASIAASPPPDAAGGVNRSGAPEPGAESGGASAEARVVEVPPLGFAFVDWTTPEEKPKRATPLAAGNILHNEFFEVTIHPTGGGVQMIRDFRHRGNRMSQQIALRGPGPIDTAPGAVWRDPDETAVYSTMQADSVEVTRSGPSVGEITSRGRLVDSEGQRLAGFVQRTRICRGSRLICLDIELEPVAELRADPWQSYYAARFAWSDSAADLFRGVHSGRHPTEAKRIEAPEFIDIETPHGPTTILSGGLPYHRRSAMRMVDSLLVVRGETARRFRLAIGIDLANSAHGAAELLAPAAILARVAAPAGAKSGWLFHLDARSVLATHWSPLGLPEDTDAPHGTGSMAGEPRGLTVRLLETSGNPVRATLRSFRPPQTARKVDFRGRTLAELEIEGDRLVCDLAGHEWAQIEARW